MKKIGMLLSLTVALAGSQAFAGKIEDVQAAVKKACSKDMEQADALKKVKDLFLTCVPGSKVDVDGCAVPCLKENSGAVVGG